jgi:biopolymer transport protein ExbD
MKTIIALIICILIYGCGKKENPPVRITINKDGTFLLNSKPSTRNQLEEYITNRIERNGLTQKVVFITDDSTLYTSLEPVILSVAKARAWWFYFKLTDSKKTEDLITDSICADGPPTKKLKVEVRDNHIFIKNKEISILGVAALLGKRPKKDWGYTVYISCSGKTTFGNLYRFLEVCNQYEYVAPVLLVMDNLYMEK